MLRKPAHFIFYLSMLQKPAAGAGFCNVLKYKDDTFYLSPIQKPAPVLPVSLFIVLCQSLTHLQIQLFLKIATKIIVGVLASYMHPD